MGSGGDDPGTTLEAPSVGNDETLVRQFRLTVVAGPDQGKRFTSEGSRVVIGRHKSADLTLDDATVSRFHCEIALRDGKGVLTDLGSRRGTVVNGLSVLSVYLKDGARIVLGSSELTFDLGPRHIRIPLSARTRFGRLVGRSPAMRATFAAMERVAAAPDSTVLLVGETGTGKELAAEALHEESARRDGPFVVVDCAGLVPALLESELFGHEAGAFTGALRARAGALEAAAGGTVFLDEVGELPLELQPKLLGVLERRRLRRIGGDGNVPIDVRVIAATNRNLWADVNNGRFRSDLYYRLAVLVVAIPPLRERLDDVPILVEEFLAAGGGPGDVPPYLRTPSVLAALAQHPWPGNVRELRNFVERVRHGDLLPPAAGESADATSPVPISIDTKEPFQVGRDRWLRAFERRYLYALMMEHDHNISSASRAADLDRSTLYRMLFRCGLAQPRKKGE